MDIQYMPTGIFFHMCNWFIHEWYRISFITELKYSNYQLLNLHICDRTSGRALKVFSDLCIFFWCQNPNFNCYRLNDKELPLKLQKQCTKHVMICHITNLWQCLQPLKYYWLLLPISVRLLGAREWFLLCVWLNFYQNQTDFRRITPSQHRFFSTC